MLRTTIQGHSDAVDTVAFSPDGTTVASGSRDRDIKLWDVATGNRLDTRHSFGAVSIRRDNERDIQLLRQASEIRKDAFRDVWQRRETFHAHNRCSVRLHLCKFTGRRVVIDENHAPQTESCTGGCESGPCVAGRSSHARLRPVPHNSRGLSGGESILVRA